MKYKILIIFLIKTTFIFAQTSIPAINFPQNVSANIDSNELLIAAKVKLQLFRNTEKILKDYYSYFLTKKNDSLCRCKINIKELGNISNPSYKDGYRIFECNAKFYELDTTYHHIFSFDRRKKVFNVYGEKLSRKFDLTTEKLGILYNNDLQRDILSRIRNSWLDKEVAFCSDILFYEIDNTIFVVILSNENKVYPKSIIAIIKLSLKEGSIIVYE